MNATLPMICVRREAVNQNGPNETQQHGHKAPACLHTGVSGAQLHRSWHVGQSRVCL